MSGPDLTCDEPGLSGLDSPHASVDLSLLQDRRVLDNMLRLQSTMLPTDEYLYSPSSDIKPAMRKVVTNWMLEAMVLVPWWRSIRQLYGLIALDTIHLNHMQIIYTNVSRHIISMISFTPIFLRYLHII
ncbi:hypothetical protein HAZT_HAZT002581 [Hyalella azteca]|uniref:Cyclin N-terminal domain-containing protein n=1 Tax=Hyalella azteca TaxID=294128 RepID=A0A6A0GPT9_HYAAZ|nr:hypothetical protein HAZT_HAZT002581 [Hyalella azteca]